MYAEGKKLQDSWALTVVCACMYIYIYIYIMFSDGASYITLVNDQLDA